MQFHILKTGLNPGPYNMALDEALLETHIAGGCPPIVRLYGWNPPAVTIGYSEKIEDVIDIARCRASGIDIIRRLTGGGAVIHDNEITYSLIAPEKFIGAGIADSFRFTTRAIIFALELLGLEAEFAPINDIIVQGKKISGNAQVRRRGSVLQHGTILLSADKKKMFSLLKIPETKLERKKLAHAADRITAADELLDRDVGFDEAEAALEKGFHRWSGEELPDYNLNENIIALTSTFISYRYSNPDWNYRRKTMNI